MSHKFYTYSCLLLFFCLSCGDGGENQKTESPANPEAGSSEEAPKLSFRMPQLNPGNVRESLKAYGEDHPETQVLIQTDMGDIKLKLYEETPLHRANFIYLVKKGFFNGTVIYRIIKNFMVQGGAGDFPQRDAVKKQIGTYRVPPEYNTEKFFHKRGALAMAKKPNEGPETGSSPFDFYIIQGEKLSAGQLQAMAQRDQLKISPAQQQAYTQLGGVPSLDGLHTVFGEVTEGLDVIDKMAALKTREADGWPVDGLIAMKISVIE